MVCAHSVRKLFGSFLHEPFSFEEDTDWKGKFFITIHGLDNFEDHTAFSWRKQTVQNRDETF